MEGIDFLDEEHRKAGKHRKDSACNVWFGGDLKPDTKVEEHF